MLALYNQGLVAFAVAFVGSYAAIIACDQLRTSRMGITKSRYFQSNGYILLMSVCLGGVGIWCMHFIGMSAVEMRGHSDRLLKVRFDLGLTILSLILVLTLTGTGCYISSRDICFAKHQKEIVDLLANDSTMRTAMHTSHAHPAWLISTRAPANIIAGGFITGSGVVVMHYVGMMAMDFEGRIVWDIGIVAASIAIAFIASTAAFWILFRLLSLYPNKEGLRVICAFTMACAVCGMHYTGMQAASFVLDDTNHNFVGDAVSRPSAFLACLITAATVAFICMALALADLRYAVRKLSTELYKADDLIKHLDVPVQSLAGKSVVHYISKRKLNSFSAGILNDTVTTRHLLADELSDTNTVGDGRALSLLAVLQRIARNVAYFEGIKIGAEAVTSSATSAVDELELAERVFVDEGGVL